MFSKLKAGQIANEGLAHKFLGTLIALKVIHYNDVPPLGTFREWCSKHGNQDAIKELFGD